MGQLRWKLHKADWYNFSKLRETAEATIHQSNKASSHTLSWNRNLGVRVTKNALNHEAKQHKRRNSDESLQHLKVVRRRK